MKGQSTASHVTWAAAALVSCTSQLYPACTCTGFSGVSFITSASTGSFSGTQLDRIILGVYLLLFGVGIGLTAIGYWKPVREWAKFMYSWLGRGTSFVFLGLLSLNTASAILFVVPIVVIAIGVVYLVLACTSSVPVPLPILWSIALIKAHERENPGYPDRRREQNRVMAQNRLDKAVRKQSKQADALRKKERLLAQQESQAKETAAKAGAERKLVSREVRVQERQSKEAFP